ncbi:protein SCAR3-like isoform X2 [Neltuma alba]|uniref:protein SCAR3-like isoform X2 n=1 Tax=Neltuma alba TaxID=207710 RepID=UPI0010A540CE|nr:protein SCAR3-like isoform X2 [Prosopis alba]
MPLVRLQVRNEYGFGQPELYKETNREDPKAVLDGVAVAGLVGILRQLGDLADFAAEVFHGLQEQAMITANRSHKLMVRVQKIESSLPPLEKAVLAQTSHIHFAYTAGCEWHPRIKTKRNHFIYSDLPQFIMDSYEECRDPPRLNLLDRFDAGGPGSCLMRYSDPTFFKRVSAYSDEAYSEKFERARKSRKSKKKRSFRRKEGLRGEQMHNISGRMHFVPSAVNRRTSSLQAASTVDMAMKSDSEDHSNSLDSRAGADYIECVFHPGNSMQRDDQDYEPLSSSRVKEKANTVYSVSSLVDDNISIDSLEKQNASSSSGVTWEEKEEIVEPMSQTYDKDKITEMHAQKQDPNMRDCKGVTLTKVDYSDILSDEESYLKPVVSSVQTEEIDSEPDKYMDARNSIELESENDLDCETKREVDKITSRVTDGIAENGIGGVDSNVLDHNLSFIVSQTLSSASFDDGTSNDFPDPLQVNPPLILDLCASKSEAPVNKEMSRDLPDSEDFESPIFEQASSVSSVSLKKEVVGGFPDSLLVDPPPVSDLYATKSESSVNEEMPRVLADPQVSESSIHEEKPSIFENSAVACSVSTDSLGWAHALKDIVSPSIESDISFSGSKSSGLPHEEADRINGNNCESKETPPESSNDHSVRFWTNGGLLGLEPSKPPDFTMPGPLSKVSPTTKTETDGGQYHNSMLKINGCTVEQDLLAEVAKEIEKEPTSRCLTSSREDQAPITEKASGIHKLSNELCPIDGSSLEEIRVLAPVCVPPAAPDSKATSIETNLGKSENSSRVFGLGQMLRRSSFRQKVSFNEKSVPAGSLKSDRLEQNGQNSIIDQSLPETTFEERVDYGYPIDSLPPSPPLGHMKISFHSVSGNETPKLKLRFPDGTNRYECIRDMFPSFQLVPEPSIPLHDSGFNSDDNDTFCRSSPYLSDDCPSPHLEYNSDEWESDESPESSDHGVHDFSHNSSSTESLSSQEFTGLSNNDVNVASGTRIQNGAEPSLSGRFLDFPSFDSVSPVLHKESSRVSTVDNIVKSQGQAEAPPPPPPPPPLPPLPQVQQQISKLQLDMKNGTRKDTSGDAGQTKGLNLSESIISLQPRPSQMEQKLTDHDDHKSDGNISQKLAIHRLGQKKLNGKKEAHQEVMGKELADKDDFLHQIRTKSFNLRPTVTGKPNANTSPPKNVKVTAILEKASAIRQVVASDDGEDDDNWSDT